MEGNDLLEGDETADETKRFLSPVGYGQVAVDVTEGGWVYVFELLIARGATAYAGDVLLYCRKVVDHYNAGTDDPIADPTAGLRAMIPSRVVRHHSAIEPREMPEFMQALRTSTS